jgi:hypothetical protein
MENTTKRKTNKQSVKARNKKEWRANDTSLTNRHFPCKTGELNIILQDVKLYTSN